MKINLLSDSLREERLQFSFAYIKFLWQDVYFSRLESSQLWVHNKTYNWTLVSFKLFI